MKFNVSRTYSVAFFALLSLGLSCNKTSQNPEPKPIPLQITFGNEKSERGRFSVPLTNKEYLVFGERGGAGGTPPSLILIKMDANGYAPFASSVRFTSEATMSVVQASNKSNGNVSALVNVGLNKFIVLEADSKCQILNKILYDVKSISYLQANAAIFMEDGSVYIAGTIGFSNQLDAFLAKINSNGSIEWSRVLSNPSDEFGSGLCLLPNGNLLISGHISTKDRSEDIFLAEIDSRGQIRQTKVYGTTASETLPRLTNTNGSIVAVANQTEPNTGKNQIFSFKVDSDLNIIWSNLLKNDYPAGFNNLYSRDDEVLLAGYVARNNSDACLIDLSAENGKIKWVKAYGGKSLDEGSSVIFTPGENGWLLTATSESFARESSPKGDIYLIKTDYTGNTKCNQLAIDFSEGTYSLQPGTAPSWSIQNMGLNASNTDLWVEKTTVARPSSQPCSQ